MRNVVNVTEELAKIDDVKHDAKNRLARQSHDVKRYKALSVAKAMAEDVDLPDFEQTDAEVRLLVEGLEERRREKANELEGYRKSYHAKVKEALRTCLSRAAEEYREQAQDLIQSWKQLDAAQLALGARDLSWIHIFIPALKEMPGSTTSHSRRCLFSGKDAPQGGSDGSVEAELIALLARRYPEGGSKRVQDDLIATLTTSSSP